MSTTHDKNQSSKLLVLLQWVS